jgi:predicted acylesterase/phospholipase RssA
MTEFNLKYWRSAKEDWIFKNWDGGYEQAVLQESGLLDASPMVETFSTIHKMHGIHRKIAIGSVNANTGEYMIFDEKHAPEEDIPKLVAGSCSLPFLFSNMHLDDDHILVDGGTAWTTNLVSAVDKCRETVSSDS